MQHIYEIKAIQQSIKQASYGERLYKVQHKFCKKKTRGKQHQERKEIFVNYMHSPLWF